MKLHSAPSVPRALDLKVGGPRSGLRPGRPRIGARLDTKRNITNTHVTGYRTAEPSDSPPRASRYALSYACRPTHPSRVPAAAPAIAVATPRGARRSDPEEVACGDEPPGRRFKGSHGRKCARRPRVRSARSLHGSGRSAASRDEPLTPRLVARCARERLAERTARGRPYQLSSIHLMPTCANCMHAGSDHDWTPPPCSARACDCHRRHPRRLRGRCLVSGCDCPKYAPRTDLPKPLNAYVGRGRRWH